MSLQHTRTHHIKHTIKAFHDRYCTDSMTEANSNHLGVIEQVPSVISQYRAVELAIQSANQIDQAHLDKQKRYLLYLKIDTQDANFDDSTQIINASVVTKMQDTLIISVTINGKTFTLQCDKTKFHKNSKFSVTSEIEEEAESLIKANQPNSGINDLFVSIHGHGRLWAITDSETDTWEVLLLDEINFRISLNPQISSFTLALAFAKLALLHKRNFIYGRPTLKHLAFKADNNPGAQFHLQNMVWIKGLAIQEILHLQPLTQNILKMKDITSLLLDNTNVLNQLNVKKIEELDLKIFNYYPHSIETTNGPFTFTTIVMPHEILNADINDFNCWRISESFLTTTTFWSYDLRKQIQHLLEDLSDNTKLQTIIQNLVSFYNRNKLNPQPLPIPAAPRTPPIPPPSVRPVPVLSPPITVTKSLPAPIGMLYFISINNDLVNPLGNPNLFYKYTLNSNNQIIVGVGDMNPQSFRGDPNTYRVTFTTNTVIITPDHRHLPITFNFLSGIPYVMQVMWGGMMKKLDMRYVPPIEVT